MHIDAVKIGEELLDLRGGVIDTSSLIYLEKIQMLKTAADVFQFLLPAGVVEEFGCCPDGCMVHVVRESLSTDQAIVRLAEQLEQPVLSEDRQLLLASARQGLMYYNTLMLLLALVLQKKLDVARYGKACTGLREIARYSPVVWQAGAQVFSLYVR